MWQISDEILVITNKAVDQSKKESQCVEHHTIQLENTAKITAWHHRFSYSQTIFDEHSSIHNLSP